MLFSQPDSMEKVICNFNAMVEEFMAAKTNCKIGEDPLISNKDPVWWSPPPEGWLKINIDAAFKGNKAALGVVVRDNHGCVKLLANKLSPCESATVAELKAIEWSMALAEENGWDRVMWSSDAKFIIQDINSKHDPMGWETRYGVLAIRAKLMHTN